MGCCNNGWGGGGCLWIILLIIILCCCGGWGGNNCGCGCNNNGCNQRLRLLNTRNGPGCLRTPGSFCPRTGAGRGCFLWKTPLFEKKIPIQAKTVLAFFGRWVYDNARNAARSGPSKGRGPEPCGHRRGLFQSGKDRSGFVVRGHSSAASSILFYAFGEGEKAAGQAR